MKRFIVVWLCMILVFSSMVLVAVQEDVVEAKVVGEDGATYIVSAPFRINSNADFATSSNVSGGNGSAGNPWIIENYDIDGTGYGYCIYIGNTTEYFVVRDCYLDEASGISFGQYYSGNGIALYNVQNGIIQNNEITMNGGFGMWLWSTSNTMIFNNTVSWNNDDNIELYNSDGNTISGNHISYNSHRGLVFSSSSNNIVLNNTISDHDLDGISIWSSINNIFTNNTMINDGIAFGGTLALYWNSHGIDTSNTVNDKPVRYLKDQNGGTVPSGAGQVILANCLDIVVEDQNMDGGAIDIHLGFSNNCSISNNTLANSNYGIQLYQCKNNTFFNNIISDNFFGIRIEKSINNTIVKNTMSSNTYGISIYLSSTGNKVINNTVSSNLFSIEFIAASDNNMVYHNSFIDNTIAASDDCINSWDNGYPVGGNYWYNYSGIDNNNGPNQDIPGADGIGDTPYTFISGTGGAQDDYPLMESYNAIPHLPIRIDSNADFDEAHGVANWDTGDGTAGNPWIIENYDIDGTGFGYCIYIGNTTDHFIVKDCKLYKANGVNSWPYHYDAAINLVGVDNGHIHNNTISNNARNGIYSYWYCDNNRFTNNNVSSNSNDGISIERNCVNNTVANNTISSSGGDGVYLTTSSTMNLITNNTATNNNNGIYVSSGSNVINNNRITGSPFYGIRLASSSNTVDNNTVQGNGDGILVSSSSDNNITNNNVSYNSDDGIHLFVMVVGTSDGNLLFNNTVYSNTGHGIFIDSSCDNNFIRNNTAKANDDHGIFMVSSIGNNVANNTATSNNLDGICLASCTGSILMNNTASSNTDNGIRLASSNGNTLTNNKALNNEYGINIISSNGNDISGNNASSNTGYGIYLDSSMGNSAGSNTMFGNGIVIMGDLIEHWNTHMIDASNTVQGKPVYYWKNQTSGTVPLGAGQVILANCTNVIVEGQNLDGGDMGIEIGFSNDNHIKDCTALANNHQGIYLYSSNGNTMRNINASSNSHGIYLYSSGGSTMENVNTSSNTNEGVYIESSNGCTVANGTVSDNFHGLNIISSDDVIIENITASSNTQYGIHLSDSNSNTMTNNTALQNGRRGIHLESSLDGSILYNNISSNTWDGIRLDDSDGGTIANNTAYSSNFHGIIVSNSDNCQITNNLASLNGEFGIATWSSSGCSIYHNDLLGNDEQAYDDTGTNQWDNGYPSGGNYWSDYSGSDLFSGPFQVDPGSDGIGDEPYWNIPGTPPIAEEVIDEYIYGPAGGFEFGPFYLNNDNIINCTLYRENGGFWTVMIEGPDYSLDYSTGEIFSPLNAGDTIYAFYNHTIGYLAQDNYPLMASANLDTTPPVSAISPISPYWLNSEPIPLSVTATDDDSGVAYVELWIRSSSDNSSWSPWTKVKNDTASPWGFVVFISNNTYSEFYSRACDLEGNYEDSPLSEDTSCGYDSTPPASSANAISPTNTSSAILPISHTHTDALSGVKNVTLWYSFSSDGAIYGAWLKFITESTSPAFADYDFDFPDGDGYYQFYTIAADLVGNWENPPLGNDTWCYKVTIDQPPSSSVNQITPYWQSSSPLELTATASDDNGVVNATLWYRFNSDNSVWSANRSFGLDTSAPWNWTFNFPDGEGYYEFYSIANDTANNTETTPATADASCAYDIIPPQITDNSPATGTTGDSYTFRAVVTDNLSLSAVHVIYWFGSGSETNSTMTHTTADNYVFEINILLNSLDTLHYRIVAVDEASNWASTAIEDVTINDNDDPVADAGPDQTVDEGTIVVFDGSGSTDNLGIVNYTWLLLDGDAQIFKYGVSPSYNFTVAGNNSARLTVTDAVGNTDSDTMSVTVQEPPLDSDDDGIPDETDPDDDNDGAPDSEDDFPLDPDETTDTDSDGTGDNADTDDDGDGTPDTEDAFPLDDSETTDTDGDGIGNNADTDDDGDGVLDADDLDPLDPNITNNDDGSNTWLYLMIILVIAGIVGAVLVMRSKGKKPEPEEPKDIDN